MRNDVGRLWHTANYRRFGLLIGVLFVLLLAGSASAQYRFTQWTADSGLPQNSVRGLVQTPDGFLWVATLNGVARFDGIRFQVFDKSNTAGISSSRFTAMVRGDGGDLWLTSEDSNVVYLHNGVFTTMTEATGVRPHSVGSITSDKQGGIWIQSDYKVLRWNQSKQRFERESFSTDALHFEALWWVGTGFWAHQGKSLVVFERGKFHVSPLPAMVKPEQVRAVASGADGALWIGTRDGRSGRILGSEPFTLQSGPHVTPMLNPAEAHWIVEISDHFERRLSFPIEGLKHPITYNVFVSDNEGNFWVGSEGNGLYRIQRQSVRSLSQTKGLVSNNVYPILRSRNGDMWVGSWPAGLSQVREGKVIHTYTIKDGLPGLVSSLAEDSSGALWIGTHGGTRKLVAGKLVSPGKTIDDLHIVPQVIQQAKDGSVWLGTPRGLYVVNGSSTRVMTTANGLATDDVRVIIADRHGDLWVGGYGGLTRIHDGQLTRWTEVDGLPSNNVRAVVEDSDGDIWVGTYDGGIGWLRNGHWVTFNQKRGLFDNGAFQLLEDTTRHFWISSNRGLYRVDRAQLAAVADGREALVTSIAYGRADGMLSVECNGGLWPAGSKDSNGALWFPTQMGVAIIDPGAVHIVEQPPRVTVGSVIVDNKAQAITDTVTMLPGQSNLEVNYTALSYTKPDSITFRFRLEGVDESWQQVGLRRAAYYTHLPPGNYMFRVTARNSDGIFSQQDATLHVVVVPPFYRRTWFIILMSLAAVLAISGLWQYRVTQLKHAQTRQRDFSRQLIASQEGERRRIAADLHDSLGQRLIIINNLALFLLRAKGKVRTEDEKRQTMEEISGEASAAIEETRAISYALRPFQLDRLGLTRAIQALCNTVMRASEITVRTDLIDIDDAFPEDLRINVYRIVQEGLNNIVKHSGASQATVKARRIHNQVTLTIQDDGRGMPPKPRVHAPGRGGFGMTGMRERITLLNGSFLIESSPSTGTLLTIELPIEMSKSV